MAVQLPHLDSFVAVYRAGTVTGAADALGLSQPAVSSHLRALEQALGRPLFVRWARGVAATPLAHALAAEVAGPLDALHSVADTFAPGAGPLAGTCVLGGPGDVLAAVDEELHLVAAPSLVSGGGTGRPASRPARPAGRAADARLRRRRAAGHAVLPRWPAAN